MSIPSARSSARCGAREYTRPLPRFQVDISVNNSAATTSVNQPPLGIFTTLAPRNARSTVKKKPTSSATTSGFQRQRLRATNAKITVVIAIVEVTAMP